MYIARSPCRAAALDAASAAARNVAGCVTELRRWRLIGARALRRHDGRRTNRRSLRVDRCSPAPCARQRSADAARHQSARQPAAGEKRGRTRRIHGDSRSQGAGYRQLHERAGHRGAGQGGRHRDKDQGLSRWNRTRRRWKCRRRSMASSRKSRSRSATKCPKARSSRVIEAVDARHRGVAASRPRQRPRVARGEGNASRTPSQGVPLTANPLPRARERVKAPRRAGRCRRASRRRSRSAGAAHAAGAVRRQHGDAGQGAVREPGRARCSRASSASISPGSAAASARAASRRTTCATYVKSALAGRSRTARRRRCGRRRRTQSAAVAADRFRQVRRDRDQAAVEDQEDLRREPRAQLGDDPARHAARRCRRHRARSAARRAQQGKRKGRHQAHDARIPDQGRASRR